MEASHKKILKPLVLELRHMLEGYYNGSGWHAGDLEQRMNALGVWRDRKPLGADELTYVTPADEEARRVVDAYLKLRDEAGVRREEAVAEFVRETAYTWANRLLALRCMEARELIDEVVLQKDVYGGRSLEHNRLAQRHPELCAGEDDGLFAALDAASAERAEHLPLLFDPKAPSVALKPSVGALKRAVALLSGTEAIRGQDLATTEVFQAPDALGWAYQYWNTEENRRVFEKVRTQEGAKIEGADIIPATQLYTEPYMVKFLVQNSLGATWAGMYPKTELSKGWDYFVKNADRVEVDKKPVCEITFLDPACGSGHFLLEAFDIFYGMYEEEAKVTEAADICRSILEHNLYGLDIDERAVQISEAAIWMKAAEKVLQATGAASLDAVPTNLVATNIRLPKGTDHLTAFIEKHPEDEDLSSALDIVFNGLQHADELGSLLEIEGPVESKLKELQLQREQSTQAGGVQANLYHSTLIQGQLPVGVGSYEEWKGETLTRLKEHFAEESAVADVSQAFFGRSARRGLRVLDLLARRYDVVAANPPYMGSGNMGPVVKSYVETHYKEGRRDLYGAFIVRAEKLSTANGYVAMITLDSWLTKDSYIGLRKRLLTRDSVEHVVRLGRYAFSDADPPGFPTLFVIQQIEPDLNHRVGVFAIRQAMESEKQGAVIRTQVTALPDAYFLAQRQLRDLPRSVILTGVTSYMLELLTDRTPLSERAELCEPSTTGANERFVRFHWEIREIGDRWFLMAKGGGHKRWKGLEMYVLDWGWNGTRIKSFPGSYVRNAEQMFKQGLTYTAMSRHGISFRAMADGMTFGKAGPGIFPPLHLQGLTLAMLNSRIYEYLLRSLNPGASISLGAVGRLPLVAAKHPELTQRLAALAVQVTADGTRSDLLERDFVPRQPIVGISLISHVSDQMIREIKRECVLLLSRDRISRYVEDSLDLDSTSAEVLSQQPFVSDLPFCSRFGLVRSESENEGVAPSSNDDEITAMFVRAKALLAQESTISEDNDRTDETEDDEDSSDQTSFYEGRLDLIARSLGIHPVSVCGMAVSAIRDGSLINSAAARRLVQDQMTMITLSLLGHVWPKQAEGECEHFGATGSSWIIPVTEAAVTESLTRRVSRALIKNFGANASSEFEQVVGSQLDRWLEREFFPGHTRQFRHRPLAWQIQSSNFSGRRVPAFGCLVYYRKLGEQALTTIQSQFVRPLRQRYETEMRGIESVPQKARSDRQQDRLTELMDIIPELRSFDERLETLSRNGFGPERFISRLRQSAIDDAMLCFKSQWLDKLSATIAIGPLKDWQQAAKDTNLHCDLASWIRDAMAALRCHCSVVGPEAPRESIFDIDPTETELALLISRDASKMAIGALDLACAVWWRRLDDAVFAPLRAQIKEARDELKALKGEDVTKAPDPHIRRREIEVHTKSLKESVRRWQRDLDESLEKAEGVRKKILTWSCPQARDWEAWLASKAMYDAISSLDGIRQPPRTVADFVSQESAYVPDINDGVRVNIAPLQKAGLLAADVLATKDLDKAIGDRAEWRAQERRWCREGKLPQPGWWSMEKKHASGQE